MGTQSIAQSIPSVPQKQHCTSLLPLRWRTKGRLYPSKRYESTHLQLVTKTLSTINQPDRESVIEVELSIGPEEVVEEGHVVATHKVRVHTTMWVHHCDHRLVQVPCDVQAANSQAAGGNSIYRPIDFS